MTKALVTGAYGFIGSHVVRQLLNRGVEVRAMHLPRESLDSLAGLDVEPVVGDVRNLEVMRDRVRGCQQVFHLAGLYALWAPQQRLFWDINVDGTLNTLRAAGEHGVDRVVYTSTIAVTGGQGQNRDATEETSFGLSESGDIYSQTKYAAHRVVDGFAAMGLPVVTVSPCGPIGPNDVGPTPTGKLLTSALNGPVTAITDSIVNLGDVRDIAAGHLLAADKGRIGENYLLGNTNVAMRDLVRIAHQIAFGRPRRIVSVPRPVLTCAGYAASFTANRITHRAPMITAAAARASALGGRADCAKAFAELGLPSRPLQESVLAALQWWAQRDGYIANPQTRHRLLSITG